MRMFNLLVDASRTLIFLTLLTACSTSTLNKMAAKSSAGLLYEAGKAIEEENDYDFFASSVPANLKMAESMLSLDPKNSTLLATLTKGYTAYAFALRETELFELTLSNANEDKLEASKEKMLASFAKAHDYGQRYFNSKGMDFSKIIELQNDSNALKKELDKTFSSSVMDLETVMFTAQSLGSIINYRKDEMALISRLGIVKNFYDWACSKKPDLAFGACDIFFATFEISRPKMLGGNPELGKKIFFDAMKKYPHNWLIITSYLQYGAIPLSDEDGFKEVKSILMNAEILWRKSKQYSIDEAAENQNAKLDLGDSRLRVFQMIAMKRWEIIKKFEKNIF